MIVAAKPWWLRVALGIQQGITRRQLPTLKASDHAFPAVSAVVKVPTNCIAGFKNAMGILLTRLSADRDADYRGLCQPNSFPEAVLKYHPTGACLRLDDSPIPPTRPQTLEAVDKRALRSLELWLLW